MEKKQKQTAKSLPIVYCKGTHYEIGYCIGHTFAKRINDWFENPMSPMKLFRSFWNHSEGGKLVAKYLETAEKCFQEYVQEMRGIADGSGAAYDDIVLQNLITEICFVHKDLTDKLGNYFPDFDKLKDVVGCTSIYVNRKGMRLLAHNEDGEFGSERYNFLAQATIVDDNNSSLVKEYFTTYMYPGMIPGFAFNVTKYFVITANTLVPQTFCHSGVPASFVVRKLLACKTIEEMVETAKCKPYGCAYAFNLNIASVKGTDMWSMEVLPGENGTEVYLHKVPIVPDEAEFCHYFHHNFYKQVNTAELPLCEGALARGKYCDEMDAPRDMDGIRRILGDTENNMFPIYRGVVEEKPTSKTVCSSLFNITEEKLYLFLDNPKLNEPFAAIGFP